MRIYMSTLFVYLLKLHRLAEGIGEAVADKVLGPDVIRLALPPLEVRVPVRVRLVHRAVEAPALRALLALCKNQQRVTCQTVNEAMREQLNTNTISVHRDLL